MQDISSIDVPHSEDSNLYDQYVRLSMISQTRDNTPATAATCDENRWPSKSVQWSPVGRLVGNLVATGPRGSLPTERMKHDAS